MNEARKPANWHWLWRRPSPSAAALSEAMSSKKNIDTRLREPADRRTPNASDIFVAAPKLDDDLPNKFGNKASGFSPGVDSRYLAKIEDDRVLLRSEREAWFNLLEVLNNSEAITLEKASAGPVGFVQLFEQPQTYRGRLVDVTGTVHRVHHVDAPQNEHGIDRYFICWIRPSGGANSPIVSYVLEIPKNFPVSEELREEVGFTGFFFKRLAYVAKDGSRTAPLILAKTMKWNRPVAAAPEFVETLSAGTFAFFLVLTILCTAAVAVGLATLIYRQNQRRRISKVDRPLVLLVMLLVPPHAIAQEPAATIRPMRELLGYSGIGDSEWEQLRESKPFRGAQVSTLLKVLFRLPSVRPENMANWSQEYSDDQLLAAPFKQQRGTVYRLTGRVQNFKATKLSAEQAQRWGFSQYFRVIVHLDGSSTVATIFARSVPGAWSRKVESGLNLDERMSAHAVFLKNGETHQSIVAPMFATARVRWHPDRVNEQLGVDQSLVLLGAAGMDIGLLDDVRDRQGLLAADRECFYQMLAVVKAVPYAELLRLAASDTALHVLLDRNEYPRWRGRVVALTGNVRRAVRISIEAPDIQSRLGIDHYYELNMFIDESVKVIRSKEDPEPVYYSRYPIVCCVRQLPQGIPLGEDINESVRVVGFFYKLYAYESEFTSTLSENRQQLSPLIIGFEPQRIQPSRADNSQYGLLFGSLCLILLAGLCLLLWRNSRRDKIFRKMILARKYDPPKDKSLDELDLDVPTPDNVVP